MQRKYTREELKIHCGTWPAYTDETETRPACSLCARRISYPSANAVTIVRDGERLATRPLCRACVAVIAQCERTSDAQQVFAQGFWSGQSVESLEVAAAGKAVRR
jgi:hypothetical protein